jgi:hypothetical protein
MKVAGHNDHNTVAAVNNLGFSRILLSSKHLPLSKVHVIKTASQFQIDFCHTLRDTVDLIFVVNIDHSAVDISRSSTMFGRQRGSHYLPKHNLADCPLRECIASGEGGFNLFDVFK